MSKSILVIDTPESCEECPLKRYSNLQLVCTPMNRDAEDVECPLRALPERKAKTLTQCESAGEWLRYCGYDECLDEIMGDEDE